MVRLGLITCAVNTARNEFAVKSPSGMTYQVEVRDVATRSFSCTCPDFRTAGLGTCKHVEATLIWLKRRHKADYKLAEAKTAPRLHLVPDGERLRIERDIKRLPTSLRDTSRAAAVSALFHETEWRGDTPKLHVLDEATWSSLQKLAETGLITFNTRATRHLSGEAPPPPPKPALTPEQIQRIADLRAFAAKKQKSPSSSSPKTCMKTPSLINKPHRALFVRPTSSSQEMKTTSRFETLQERDHSKCPGA